MGKISILECNTNFTFLLLKFMIWNFYTDETFIGSTLKVNVVPIHQTEPKRSRVEKKELNMTIFSKRIGSHSQST